MGNKAFTILVSLALIVLLVAVIVLRVCLGATTTFFAIAAVDWAAQIILFGWIIVRSVKERRRQRRLMESVIENEHRLRVEYSFLRKVAGLPTKFRYRDLQAATDNFSALLGKGASASVFKGILDDGSPVAVKRIHGSEHGQKDFQSEVMAIASVQHINLVRLLGYCLENGHRLLVYEFIPNGSLDTWIFPGEGRNAVRRVLPMDTRFAVAVDVAKALAYLHEDCRKKILHLDVKPENILLDECFQARVTDFGLSKLMGRDESQIVTTVRGTKGYLAPEWLLENGISEKCDIYSYGMVLLELVGGRRNVVAVRDGEGNSGGRRWSIFPKIVMQKLREGKLMEVVDQRLPSSSVDERQVTTLVNVALWCIQEKPRLRPSMSLVVDMLQGRARIDRPPEPDMSVADLLADDEDDDYPHIDQRQNASSSGGSSAGLPQAASFSIELSAVIGR
ncbi:putative receptor-like protein kinase [Nymphaea thermarum]|nr:putative receptor-like protein kinase [Nymphaea thermarum]